MDDDHHPTYPASKIVPFLGKQVIDGFLITPDSCFPLRLVQKKFGILVNIADSDSPQLADFLEEENVCVCLKESLYSTRPKSVRVVMDLILFSLVVAEWKRSRIFRCNSLTNFRQACKRRLVQGEDVEYSCFVCDRVIWMADAQVCLRKPRKNVIDYKWNRKLEILLKEKCELENTMAWLSTLGGAFSALGDTYVDCAEKAGLISIQQLHLAFRLGDPLTICRCRVYLVMSMLQKGYYSRAKAMIRILYKFAVGPEGSKDFRLKNMCIAVWNRLKYLLLQKPIMYQNKTCFN